MEQQNQQPQQNTQSQPPLSLHKKGIFNTKFKLFFIVALVAVISVGGILLLKTMESSLPPAPSPMPIAQQTPPPVPSPQPQTLDTSGWQTYRNDEFGFEVKYPGDWTVNEDGNISLGKNTLDVAIVVWNDGSKEYVETQWQAVPCAPGGGNGCAPLPNKETKTLEINGNTVYWKVGGSDQVHAFIAHEQKNKTIELYTVNLKDQELFDQILSTFRFIE